MKIHLLPLLIVIVLSLHIGCTDQVAGGGLDTESSGGKLRGMVVDIDGKAACNAQLRLLPENYTPFDTSGTYKTSTTTDGTFFIDHIDTGAYNLQINYNQSGTCLLYRHIVVTDSDDTIPLEQLKLQKPGSIRLTLESDSTFRNNTVAYIPGTRLSVVVTSNSNILDFDSLPPGIIPAILYSDTSGKLLDTLAKSIDVQSSQMITISIVHPWSHFMNISIDNSLPGLATTFPGPFALMLQFDSTTFDTHEALTKGNHIKVTDRNGKPLPFEIELWDTTSSFFTLWVRLDSVATINNDNFITMSWGNASAQSISGVPSVFDSSSGFRGVYHLNEEKVGVKNHQLYSDASEMRNHADDIVADREQVQWIGNAKHFEYGEEDYVYVDNPKGFTIDEKPFTLSCWFNSDYTQQCALFRWYFATPDTHSLGAMIEKDNTIGIYYDSTILIKSKSFTITEWHHLLLTRSTDGLLSLYLDGELNQNIVFPDALGSDSNSAVFIGSDRTVLTAYGDRPVRSFNGYIDEFRVEATERSPAYVRYTYITQSNKKAIRILSKK